MRRLLLAWVLLLIGAASATGQTVIAGAYTNYCQAGNQKASTQGLSSSNTLQGSFPGCTVAVYLTGTSTLATLYSNAGLTPLANPFTAPSGVGPFTFFADVTSVYDVTTSGSGVPTVTYPSVSTGGLSASGLPAINIVAYGAKCDGATDDYAAIQAAINAAELVVAGNSFAAVTGPANATCLFGSNLSVIAAGNGNLFLGAAGLKTGI